MRIVEIGGRPITTEERTVSIIDASGGGLCVLSNEDLPIRRGVIAVFEFTMLNYSFVFHGTFVRKIDDLKKFEYGVRFIDVDDRQQAQFISVLGRLQVERHSRTAGV